MSPGSSPKRRSAVSSGPANGRPESRSRPFGAPAAPLSKHRHQQRKGRPLTIVSRVEANDVLLGRGTRISKYPGNLAFHALIHEKAIEYSQATDVRGQKMRIAQSVIECVHRRNGRFLRRLEPRDTVDPSPLRPDSQRKRSSATAASTSAVASPADTQPNRESRRLPASDAGRHKNERNPHRIDRSVSTVRNDSSSLTLSASSTSMPSTDTRVFQSLSAQSASPAALPQSQDPPVEPQELFCVITNNATLLLKAKHAFRHVIRSNGVEQKWSDGALSDVKGSHGSNGAGEQSTATMHSNLASRALESTFTTFALEAPEQRTDQHAAETSLHPSNASEVKKMSATTGGPCTGQPAERTVEKQKDSTTGHGVPFQAYASPNDSSHVTGSTATYSAEPSQFMHDLLRNSSQQAYLQHQHQAQNLHAQPTDDPRTTNEQWSLSDDLSTDAGAPAPLPTVAGLPSFDVSTLSSEVMLCLNILLVICQLQQLSQMPEQVPGPMPNTALAQTLGQLGSIISSSFGKSKDENAGTGPNPDQSGQPPLQAYLAPLVLSMASTQQNQPQQRCREDQRRSSNVNVGQAVSESTSHTMVSPQNGTRPISSEGLCTDNAETDYLAALVTMAMQGVATQQPPTPHPKTASQVDLNQQQGTVKSTYCQAGTGTAPVAPMPAENTVTAQLEILMRMLPATSIAAVPASTMTSTSTGANGNTQDMSLFTTASHSCHTSQRPTKRAKTFDRFDARVAAGLSRQPGILPCSTALENTANVSNSVSALISMLAAAQHSPSDTGSQDRERWQAALAASDSVNRPIGPVHTAQRLQHARIDSSLARRQLRPQEALSDAVATALGQLVDACADNALALTNDNRNSNSNSNNNNNNNNNNSNNSNNKDGDHGYG